MAVPVRDARAPDVLQSHGVVEVLVTRVEAQALHKGSVVVDPTPPHRPFTVREVYLPKGGTPMARIAGIRKGAWVQLESFDLPPAGQRWDAATGSWR